MPRLSPGIGCDSTAQGDKVTIIIYNIKIKINIKPFYCHVASTWKLDVVAYIIHTYIHIYIHKYTYLHTYILTHKVNLDIQSRNH